MVVAMVVRALCAPWVLSHWCNLPSSPHATAEPRTSSGHAATRWLMKRPFTTTSQSAKKSGPLMAGMPRNDVSNTTLLPAPS